MTVAVKRLVWVGPLAVGASVLINVCVRQISVGFFGTSSTYEHFEWRDFISTTIGSVIAGVIVFAIVARYSRDPTRVFVQIAVAFFVVSLIGPFSLLLTEAPGADWGTVGTLIVMHVTTLLTTIAVLTVGTRDGSVRDPHR